MAIRSTANGDFRKKICFSKTNEYLNVQHHSQMTSDERLTISPERETFSSLVMAIDGHSDSVDLMFKFLTNFLGCQTTYSSIM